MEKPRKRYIQQFKQYPDVVSVLTFREMLGGIGDSFARKLIHEGLVKAIFIKPHYWIFKESIIDYVLSEDYEIIESPLYAENIEEKGGAADDAAKTDLR